MDSASPLEDWRGVDLGQIRRQLRMPVEERVQHMVEVATTLMKIPASAQFIDARRR